MRAIPLTLVPYLRHGSQSCLCLKAKATYLSPQPLFANICLELVIFRHLLHITRTTYLNPSKPENIIQYVKML